MPTTQEPQTRWHSPAIILLAWLILQLGGLFTPPLLDDVDSVYIEVAREMLHRHDYVTPYIDGIRFFDKPPLMYWLAAGSMAIFGEHDYAARLPLALAFLALLFAIHALGRRFYGKRGALYAALIFATALGPWLYTRFFIPDLLICLWMTLSVHLFLTALTRVPDVTVAWSAGGVSFAEANDRTPPHTSNPVILSEAQRAQPKDPEEPYPAIAGRAFPSPASPSSPPSSSPPPSPSTSSPRASSASSSP